MNNNKEEPDKNGGGEAKPPEDENQKVFCIPSTRESVEIEADTLRQIHKLAYVFERLRLSEYISMLQNTKRLLLMNFLAGLARGFGVIIGMTVLVAVFLYIMSGLVDAPLVGKYVAKLVHIVQEELKVRKM